MELKIPPVKTALKPLHVTEEGLVKRVRGEGVANLQILNFEFEWRRVI